MHFIEFTLDEDYCFGLPNGGRLEIPFYGTVNIAYDPSTLDWWMVDAHLSASNGKMGAKAHSWEEPITSAHMLFGIIERYLQTQAERVDEKIRDNIAAEIENFLADEGKERAKNRAA